MTGRKAVKPMSSVNDRVTALVDPILADLSLELYDVDFAGGVLRVTIDTPPGSPAGVDIDKISLVSRLLGRELDHDETVVPGRFTLEVSSPGLERTLRTPAHFAREVGKQVSMRLREQVEGRRRVAGVLVGCGDTGVRLREDEGPEIEVPFAAIEKARTVFVWESNPKPGSPDALRAKARKNLTSHNHEDDTEDDSL